MTKRNNIVLLKNKLYFTYKPKNVYSFCAFPIIERNIVGKKKTRTQMTEQQIQKLKI
jgi:hypothetical protein